MLYNQAPWHQGGQEDSGMAEDREQYSTGRSKVDVTAIKEHSFCLCFAY